MKQFENGLKIVYLDVNLISEVRKEPDTILKVLSWYRSTELILCINI